MTFELGEELPEEGDNDNGSGLASLPVHYIIELFKMVNVNVRETLLAELEQQDQDKHCQVIMEWLTLSLNHPFFSSMYVKKPLLLLL